MKNGNGAFTVEKGIPMPRKLMADTYPFATMDVGDSFLIECAPAEWQRQQCKIREYAVRWVRKSPEAAQHKFSCRKVEGGVRVWRTQ